MPKNTSNVLMNVLLIKLGLLKCASCFLFNLTCLLASVNGHQSVDACLSTIDHVIPVFVFDVIDYVYITFVADYFRRTVQKEF